MTETEQASRVVYMCLKDGGPLCEGEAPLVFEDVADAEDAMLEAGDEEGFVAEIAIVTVIARLRSGGITHVYYQPSGIRPASIRSLEEIGAPVGFEDPENVILAAQEKLRAEGKPAKLHMTLREAYEILQG